MAPHHLPGNGDLVMSQNDAWSPGEPLGTEAFEQGDEALDEGSLIDSSLVETVEQDSSLDSAASGRRT